MFGLSLFHPSMTYGKREFSKCSVQQGNTQKVLGCLENFSFVEVSYEYIWWLLGWKEFLKQTQLSYPSSLVELNKSRFLVQFTTRGAFNDFCYCYCRVMLHWFNFIWKRCLGLLIINNISIVKMRTYERSAVDQ